jgi:hypothetical protein
MVAVLFLTGVVEAAGQQVDDYTDPYEFPGLSGSEHVVDVQIIDESGIARYSINFCDLSLYLRFGQIRPKSVRLLGEVISSMFLSDMIGFKSAFPTSRP